MIGKIQIFNHTIECTIGVEEFEKANEQKIFVDLSVKKDFSLCVRSDSVNDTVNYVILAKICTSIAKSKHYALLETYAYDVLQEIFCSFDILWAKILVKKPDALPEGDYCSVELEQTRDKVGL